MSTVAQIEDAVFALPQEQFLSLLDRMNQRVDHASENGIKYESPELEAELLKAADGPWLPVDDAFWESIRQSWPSNQKVSQCPA
jgi:hypothetical protein